VVWHHHELVQLELPGQSVRPKHVDKKLGFVLRLKNRSVHVGLASGKKRPSARDYIPAIRLSCELYHTQRLKPEFYSGPYGPAEAWAQIRT
jgi:hypothetical protein